MCTPRKGVFVLLFRVRSLYITNLGGEREYTAGKYTLEGEKGAQH